MRGEGFRNTNRSIILRDRKETACSFPLRSLHICVLMAWPDGKVFSEVVASILAFIDFCTEFCQLLRRVLSPHLHSCQRSLGVFNWFRQAASGIWIYQLRLFLCKQGDLWNIAVELRMQKARNYLWIWILKAPSTCSGARQGWVSP